MSVTRISEREALDSHAFYARGYHSRIHRHLIEDDEYYWARAEASASFYFTDPERSASIFEYGCGIGQGIARLPNASGWDPSEEAREHARQHGVKVYETIDCVPARHWDIVFCRHVLEHIEDPATALRTMHSLISDTGYLYLILPKEKHRRCDLEPDLNQHLYAWNYRTITNLLHHTGFTPYYQGDFYVLGSRRLLPVQRLLGKRCYRFACRAVGLLKRNAELVIKARCKTVKS